MRKEKVTVVNPMGFHLKPAGVLCELAIGYRSKITYHFGTVTVNAKSILSVLASKVQCGQELEFAADGEDEEEALKAVVAAIRNGLGEEL